MPGPAMLTSRAALAALLAVSLSACLSSGTSDTRVDDDPDNPLPPVVNISASPTNVDFGDTSTLTWSTTYADSCTATGSWSGSKAVSGSEAVGPLNVDSQFTLTCSGAGGSTAQSATVTVNSSSPSPTLVFTATPNSISQGSSAMLDWNAGNVTSCTATGAWSGSRPTMGSESTGNLNGNATYTLTCDGTGGSISRTVTVTVNSAGGPGVSGAVDSSLIDRYGAENRVYVYAGNVTPDDYDGDGGDPLMSAVVRQDEGACTFGYDTGALAAGNYTVAFTNDAGNDDPQQSDPISFSGTTSLSVDANGAIVNFAAANVIRVGPGRAYQTVAAAAAVAQDGDVVEIDAGLYVRDVAAWYQDDLTLRGVGGYAHLRADGAHSQGKGIWVIGGTNTVVENIEFSEVTVPDENGAGIRHDGYNLVVCNGYFHDSEEGILGGDGDVLVEYSEFDNNGFGDGYTHNMYILDAERFTIRHSYTHHARIGHNVKSRARENYILYNRIMDESTGNASYAVDIPNGGLSFVIGNLLQQGPNTDNSAIVNYGTEGLSGGRTHNLYLVNNTLVDDYGGTFIQAANGTALIRLVNNLFVGSGNIISGPQASMTSNLQTTAPGLVDIDAFDYRLTSGSPARDAGTAPGSGNGVDLNPIYQYVHRSTRELRPADGPIDIGAYEYEP